MAGGAGPGLLLGFVGLEPALFPPLTPNSRLPARPVRIGHASELFFPPPGMGPGYLPWMPTPAAPIQSLALSTLISLASLAASAAAAGKWEPPPGKTLLMIGQDRESAEAYIASMGHVPAGIMLYTNLADLGGLRAPADFGAGYNDLGHWMARRPPVTLQIGLYLVKMLDRINAGSLDGNIDAMADILRDTRRPVFLRIGYEFDSDWAAYEPGAYRKAYQRIVDRFRALKADNVAFVWHSWGYHYSFGRAAPDDWYPGDGYVDWCALSYFSPWNETTRVWSARSRRNMIEFARRKGKPLMVAESSTKAPEQPSLGSKSWDGWFVPMLAFADTSGAKALCYINADWDAQPLWQGQGWGDSRIQTHELVKRNWLAEISGPRWLLASDSLFDILSRGSSGIRVRGKDGDGKNAGYGSEAASGWGARRALVRFGRDWLGRMDPGL